MVPTGKNHDLSASEDVLYPFAMAFFSEGEFDGLSELCLRSDFVTDLSGLGSSISESTATIKRPSFDHHRGHESGSSFGKTLRTKFLARSELSTGFPRSVIARIVMGAIQKLQRLL